jgi:hypothetical protein
MSQPNGEIGLTENDGTLTSGGMVGTDRDFGVTVWGFGHGFLTTMTSPQPRLPDKTIENNHRE